MAKAEVVKLVDTLASGASRGNPVEVQVLSSAPNFSKWMGINKMDFFQLLLLLDRVQLK